WLLEWARAALRASRSSAHEKKADGHEHTVVRRLMHHRSPPSLVFFSLKVTALLAHAENGRQHRRGHTTFRTGRTAQERESEAIESQDERVIVGVLRLLGSRVKKNNCGGSIMSRKTGDFSHILWPRCCCLSWHGRLRAPGAPGVLTPPRRRSTLAPAAWVTGSRRLPLRRSLMPRTIVGLRIGLALGVLWLSLAAVAQPATTVSRIGRLSPGSPLL